VLCIDAKAASTCRSTRLSIQRAAPYPAAPSAIAAMTMATTITRAAERGRTVSDATPSRFAVIVSPQPTETQRAHLMVWENCRSMA
jgi:hypothetical protein